MPAFAGVVGTVNAKPRTRAIVSLISGGYCSIEPAGLAGSDGDINLHQVIWQTIFQRLPGVATIRRFEKTTAGSLKLIVVFPGTFAHFPQRCVEHIGIRRIHLDIGAASILVFVKDFLPSAAAVGRSEDATLVVRPVRMPEYRSE